MYKTLKCEPGRQKYDLDLYMDLACYDTAKAAIAQGSMPTV